MRKTTRLISVLLSLAILANFLPIIANAENNINEKSNSIQIGDYITLGTYQNEPIVWRCVDIDENGPLMLSDKILCLKAYDANGESEYYHSDGWGYVRKNSGSNCWSDSSIRQWLNSQDSIVQYSHCAPSTERVTSGYNAYDKEAGFLNSFTDKELSMIKTVTQKVCINSWETKRDGYCDGGTQELSYFPSKTEVDYSTYFYQNVTDKFFLLNPRQVDAIGRNLNGYLEDTYPTVSAVENSNYKNENLSADSVWSYFLAIPRNEGASYENVSIMTSTGVSSAGASWGWFGIRPAFYLAGDHEKNIAKVEDGFNFYTNQPSNYINVGDTVKLNIGYYLKGTIDNRITRYLYTISNDIIDVVDEGWSSKYGQSLLITSKKVGVSTITVTNPDTGESSALELVVTSSDETGWSFYNVPTSIIEEGKVTNFYNYGGMVINDFSYTEHKNLKGILDYYIVTMTVYNSKNLYGAVTSYSEDGNIYSYYVIDKKSDYDKSFVDSCKSLYYNCGDLYYLIKNESYYSGKSISKETNVKIEVPVGGHLTISNNCETSEVANLANFCGAVAELATLMGNISNIKSDNEWFEEVELMTINNFLDGFVRDNTLKALNNALVSELKNFKLNYDNIQSFIAYIGNKANEILNVNFVEEIEKKLCTIGGWSSTGETIAKKILPTGWIINALYSFSDMCGFGEFFNEYCRSYYSGSKPMGISIYAPINGVSYNSKGVKINTGYISNDTVIHAYTVVDDGVANISKDTFKQDSVYYSGKYETYNITMYKNGQETQPSSTVMVQIPMPSGFNRAATKVYRNNDDGTLTDMNAYISGGYIVFETEHFSYYSVVDESDPIISDALKFSGASLTLQSNLKINYKVSDTYLDDGYDNIYIKFITNGTETVVKDYSISNDKMIFVYSNIAPNQMGDTIYATIYAELDGTIYQSETKEYSVSQYCYNMLSKYSSDEYSKLRTLIVDLLNYGAESQIYTDYHIENLVTARLTNEQLSWGTIESPTLKTVQDIEYEVIENPAVTWIGAGLNLNNSITMRFKIATDSIERLQVKVSNASAEWFIDSADFEQTSGGYYVYFNGFNAGQMRDSAFVTVYKDGEAISNTICYSIESYAYAKQNSTDEKLNNILIAMMRYGDSAYAYIH